jgi:hypothetical protein
MRVPRRGRLLLAAAALTALAAGTTIAVPNPAVADDPPPTGEIAGHVLDTHGHPVIKALVQVYQGDTYIAGGITDTQGGYDFQAVPAGSGYTVTFDTSNPDGPTTAGSQHLWYHHSLTADAATTVSVTQNQTTTVDDALFPTGDLAVVAFDQVTHLPQQQFCGSAAPQAATSNGAGGCTTTGILRLTGLLPGAYTVNVTGDGLHGDGQTSATVTAARTALAIAQLPQEAGITTTVRDAATGAPVADICLKAVATTSGGSRFLAGGTHVPGVLGSCSDENGKVQIGKLAAGNYQLFAVPTPATYGAQWVGPNGGTGQRTAAKLIRVTLGKAAAAPQVRLDAPGTITGTLTDSASAPARSVCALPYASIAAFFSGTACTDTTGHYTLTGLGPYKWPVEFVNRTGAFAWQWAGGAPNSATATLTQVTAAAPATLDASLTAGHTITGHITMPAGTSATVYAYSATTGEYATRIAPVAADGTYTLTGLAPQTVKISVEVTSTTPPTTTWYGGTTFATATPLTIPATGTVTGPDLTLP